MLSILFELLICGRIRAECGRVREHVVSWFRSFKPKLASVELSSRLYCTSFSSY